MGAIAVVELGLWRVLGVGVPVDTWVSENYGGWRWWWQMLVGIGRVLIVSLRRVLHRNINDCNRLLMIRHSGITIVHFNVHRKSAMMGGTS